MNVDFLITDYTICSHHSYSELIKLVKIYMDKDWVPHGGLATEKLSSGRTWFHQPMVKYK